MAHDKKILLPLDGSKASLTALIPAKSISHMLNIPIEVLYVSDEKLTRHQLIEKIKISEENLPGLIIVHKTGDPAEIILDESKYSQFIVMCTHGHTCNMRKMAGSLSVKVMENADIPILLVKPDVVFSIQNGYWKPRKALIPLNGTPDAALALIPTIEILVKIDTEIDLLHISCACKERPKDIGTFTTPYYIDRPQYEWPSWTKEFLRRFSRIANHEYRNHIKFNVSVKTGDPAEKILDFAKENKNDFIAIAWHGELGELHAKTLKKVLMQTPCPVLLKKIRKIT